MTTRGATVLFGVRDVLSAANVPHHGYIYPGTVHGFNCDATPERYNKVAADLVWQGTVDWFNKYSRG
jgi:carboxymethylenebutenolidase